ncbi:MAG: aminopeptidase [Anaerolineales bacterium]|nr:aminopeptidase [Anaerolineales bacterium]
MSFPSQENLQKYAELVVRVGLNLRPGQRLLINNPTTRGVLLHVAPFVREVAKAAYKAGARYVDVIWGDEAMLKTRIRQAPRDSFDEFSYWQIKAIDELLESDGAHLSIRSNNPNLMDGEDPEIINQVQKTYLKAYENFSQIIGQNKVNWLVIAASGPDWAARVFPDLEPAEAEKKLWEAIFAITRADQADPVAAWEKHVQELQKRSEYLNAKRYTALHYQALGTDLTVGLPQGHFWNSAGSTAQNGIFYIANMPTEEIYTLPHKDQINGHVSASMPLSNGGALMEDFSLTFENGHVVKATAKKNEAVLQKLVSSDEGASSLGEVALVPHNSPIAQSGLLYYDPLIDENAASHLALGRAYKYTLKGAENLSDEDFKARGGNVSMVHVDFMVGSGKMDIDGTTPDGKIEPVMRQGEWAFDV